MKLRIPKHVPVFRVLFQAFKDIGTAFSYRYQVLTSFVPVFQRVRDRAGSKVQIRAMTQERNRHPHNSKKLDRALSRICWNTGTRPCLFLQYYLLFYNNNNKNLNQNNNLRLATKLPRQTSPPDSVPYYKFHWNTLRNIGTDFVHSADSAHPRD